VRQDGAGKLGEHVSGTQCVNADALLRPLYGERGSHVPHGGLGGVVWRLWLRDVDDLYVVDVRSDDWTRIG
jgi:hypothetical protein